MRRKSPCGLFRSRASLVRKTVITSQRVAMTSKHTLTPSPRDAPEPLINLPPKKGVGNAGCPLHPRPRVHFAPLWDETTESIKLFLPKGEAKYFGARTGHEIARRANHAAVARMERSAIQDRRRVSPGFRGVYHRARIRATRWLHPGYDVPTCPP